MLLAHRSSNGSVIAGAGEEKRMAAAMEVVEVTGILFSRSMRIGRPTKRPFLRKQQAK